MILATFAQRRVWIGLLLIVVGGVAGFAITFAARSARAQAQPVDGPADAMLDWLDVPADQRDALRGHDPAFAADLQRLREALVSSRSELAQALEASDATDEQIRARSEAVIAASAALERRVMSYLLSIRDHLTPDQRKRLFGLCAQGIRQGPGWRHGQAGQPGGPGRGMGMGMGRGMGRGFRGGRGELPAPPHPATAPAADQ